jgi:hypothetical protein
MRPGFYRFHLAQCLHRTAPAIEIVLLMLGPPRTQKQLKADVPDSLGESNLNPAMSCERSKETREVSMIDARAFRKDLFCFDEPGS